VLRFFGILNAAVWLGAAVFMTAAVGPLFFSETLLRLLGRPHAGAVVLLIFERYFLLQYLCALLALAHGITDWLQTGRPFSKLRMGLLAALLALVLVNGMMIQPRLKDLHRTMYSFGIRPAPAQVEQARQSYGPWHGFSQVLNLLASLGLLVYLWQMAHLPPAPRVLTRTKFQLE
jgi:hypothetical protein